MTIDPTVVIAAFSGLIAALGAIARRIYTDLRDERNFWRDAYMKQVGTTNTAIDVAAVSVKPDA